MTTENRGEETELTQRHQEAISRIIQEYPAVDPQEVKTIYLGIVARSHPNVVNSMFNFPEILTRREIAEKEIRRQNSYKPI